VRTRTLRVASFSSRRVKTADGRSSALAIGFAEGRGVAFGIWAAAVVTAAYLASHGRGVDAVAAIVMLWAAVVAARSRWRVALCAMPALLIPAIAMPAGYRLFGVHPPQAVALLTVVFVGVSLAVEPRHRPSLWALAPALLLAVLGVVGGSVSGDLSAEGSLAVVWLAASALGSIAGRDLRYLKALTYLGSPIAAYAILECLGLPNYWTRLTQANLFATSFGTFGGLHRAVATFGHPIPASVIFASLALLAITLRERRGVPWLAALYGVACLSTLSRTGIVALAAGGAMMVLFPREPMARARAALVIAVAFIGVAVLATSLLSGSLGERITQQDNAGRAASLSILGHSLSSDPASLLFGGGFRGAGSYLASIGGNTATGLPSQIFDDELVTGIYDYGLVPLALVVLLVIAGIATTPARLRAVALPPLVATAVGFLFFDGLFWHSASFMLFFFIGMVCGFDHAAGDRVAGARLVDTT